MSIRKFIFKHLHKINRKFVYIQTGKSENIIELYNDLIESGFEPVNTYLPTNQTRFFLFVRDSGDIIVKDVKNRFDIKDKVYFDMYHEYDTHDPHDPHKTFIRNSENVVVLNYDLILRSQKIDRLKMLCMVQYPKIIKFDRKTVYQCHLPKPISDLLYEELYGKGILRKEDLEIGEYYFGKCRNANVARWDGEYFTHNRKKHNMVFPEKINHLADDNGFDLFIPIEKVIPTVDEQIK